MIVTLIGYRGSGKSSVAAALRDRLGWPVLEADRLIQERAGCSISEIFSRQGEKHFRDLEEAVITELLRKPSGILSAGGGAVLRTTTCERMRQAGPVVLLEASVSELARRISADQVSASQRPSLTDAGFLGEIEAVLTARQPIYHEAATHRIWTENKSPEAIAEEIIRDLQLQEGN